jgi:hypothetical protein
LVRFGRFVVVDNPVDALDLVDDAGSRRGLESLSAVHSSSFEFQIFDSDFGPKIRGF